MYTPQKCSPGRQATEKVRTPPDIAIQYGSFSLSLFIEYGRQIRLYRRASRLFVCLTYDVIVEINSRDLAFGGVPDNWRAGASQPSHATGTIFLYVYMCLSDAVRCLSTTVMFYVT